MRNSLIISLIIILSLTIHVVQSQEKKAVITLRPSEIKIGEQAVTGDYSLRIPSDTLGSAVEILKTVLDTSYDGPALGTKILTARLTITSFDTGFHVIAPLVFPGSNDSLRTEPVLLSVKDVAVEMPQAAADQQSEVEIRDIKKIRPATFSLWEWIKENYLLILAVLLSAAAVWAYFRYIHHRLKKKAVEIIVPKVTIPPHVIALNKLSELQEKKLWQSGMVKEYHSELTEIVRQYIEDYLRIPALESTTPEILRDLGTTTAVSSDVMAGMKKMLELSDLVKFAKYLPFGDENEKCIVHGRNFIMMTMPAEKEAEKTNHV